MGAAGHAKCGRGNAIERVQADEGHSCDSVRVEQYQGLLSCLLDCASFSVPVVVDEHEQDSLVDPWEVSSLCAAPTP